MPKFGGDVREYAIFRADFKHAIESRYSKRDAITFLRTCLQGKPLDLIKRIGSDYDAAWEYLDTIYGDPRFVSDTITQDIAKISTASRQRRRLLLRFSPPSKAMLQYAKRSWPTG